MILIHQKQLRIVDIDSETDKIYKYRLLELEVKAAHQRLFALMDIKLINFRNHHLI